MKPRTLVVFGLLTGAVWQVGPAAAVRKSSSIIHPPPAHRLVHEGLNEPEFIAPRVSPPGLGAGGPLSPSGLEIGGPGWGPAMNSDSNPADLRPPVLAQVPADSGSPAVTAPDAATAPVTPAPTTTPPTEPAPTTTTPTTPSVTPPESSTDEANEPKRRRRLLGINAGVFVPTSGKTRSRFGSSWLSVGVGLGAIRVPSTKGRLSFHYSFASRSNKSNHAFIAPLGIQYRRALTGRRSRLYAGATADLVITNLRSVEDNVASGIRTAPGGSLFIGESLGNSLSLEGRYQAVGQVRGLDLSGFSVGLGIRF